MMPTYTLGPNYTSATKNKSKRGVAFLQELTKDFYVCMALGGTLITVSTLL